MHAGTRRYNEVAVSFFGKEVFAHKSIEVSRRKPCPSNLLASMGHAQSTTPITQMHTVEGVPVTSSAMPADAPNIPIATPVQGSAPQPPMQNARNPSSCTNNRGNQQGCRRVRSIFLDPNASHGMPPAPVNAPPGGRYCYVTFFGPNSMLCCLFAFLVAPPLAFLAPCFPCDRTLVYLAPDGSAWDPHSGQMVGYDY